MKLCINDKCTDELFKLLKKFQDERISAKTTLEKALKKIDGAQGTAFYEREREKAETAYNDTIKGLRQQYESRIYGWLENMSDANASRSIPMPTDDDMRILDVLKQRTEQGGKVTKSEFDMYFNSLSDSPVARSLFNEYTTKAGILNSYLGDQPATIEYIQNIISSLGNGIKDYMESDTNTRIGNIIDSRFNRYGTIQEKPQWDTFSNKQEMFSVVLPSLNPANVPAFCECVD